MSEIDRLLQIMAQLRDPDGGCPWDVQQTFESIAPYTIEEAYEVADAIARNDLIDLRDELGDLLLQVVFHARMAEEANEFDFNDVARAINEKMLRRHPHVFGDAQLASADALKLQWENQKAEERAQKSAVAGNSESVLDGVAVNLPALTRAEKIQKRAKRVGFDWDSLPPVVAKVEEEIGEIMEAKSQENTAHIEEEVGDFLFAAVNLARHLDVDPETALRSATNKFGNRFQQLELLASTRGQDLTALDLPALDALWDEVKTGE